MFPSSPSVTGETTTVCVRACVCVRVLPGKQKDLEILNPLWISDRPDIKAIQPSIEMFRNRNCFIPENNTMGLIISVEVTYKCTARS